MNNYKQPGDVLTLTAPTGGVVAGGVYQIGQLVVVSMGDAAQTLPFEGKRTGVFSGLPKDNGVAWVEGDPLYWDDAAGDFTPTSAIGLVLAGMAVAARLLADTTGDVLLGVNVAVDE